MQQHPPIHCVVYGNWGSGKSTFFATWPKPMLVLFTDPPDKAAPYWRRGLVTHLGDNRTHVMSRKDPERLLIHVEYFADRNPQQPSAHLEFRARFLEALEGLVADGHFASLIVDGLTFLELNARKYAEYGDPRLRTAKDPRQWYAYSAHECEELIVQQCGFLRGVNVGIAAHVDARDDEVAGVQVYTPAAPGKLRTRFGMGFPEMYVAHTLVGGKDKPQRYWLQTRTNHTHAAASGMLEAPDPCEPDYKALWVNYDARAAADAAAIQQQAERAERGNDNGMTGATDAPETGAAAPKE